ncbi:hypothetical protein N9F48_01980 [Akkermansiaceae bacterium]|nr:hypothetical protein [bacterium]MDA7629911.1 hypothetical protein [Akkermansiaceae bacterium]MDA7649375.1 hypothetical protein [Akkermansiaceae bacterium]MDA7684052.1 hypothetical protein [Akkermansiaceae bacterium]MDA7935880.1 hypothetical protein [bacterium]
MKYLSLIVILFLTGIIHADDPGKEKIGSLRVEMIFATNGDLSRLGGRGKELKSDQIKAITAVKKLVFKEYRSLGVETPSILRSYESWATPLRPSKEMLVSFEPLRRDGKDRIQMALEYWQSKRKLFQTTPILIKGKPLYLLGPEWRGGRLILKVELLELTAS